MLVDMYKDSFGEFERDWLLIQASILVFNYVSSMHGIFKGEERSEVSDGT